MLRDMCVHFEKFLGLAGDDNVVSERKTNLKQSLKNKD